MGTRNIPGQQKGVDGLMIADLISLTQQRAISAALLVSGDADTAPGVVAAQGMGLRVHLLSLGTTAATSPLLAAEVDMKRSWALADVAMFASQTAASVVVTALAPSGVTVQAPASPVDFSAIARIAHTNITSGPLAALVASWPPGTFQIPADIDRALLSDAKSQLGRALHDREKPLLRNEFRALRA
ncbi:NYN domain-containing protein [Xylophilus ampelinus]|uniref:NYN domain-containing protein n=1 Tax=Xylophilus ampelinus TaxID=54067 RepID=UPI0011B564C4|nr:NYN domain-containing protein [Xylophilus ampelinus]MCS4511221.1 NYN domain-containing protein [Xylophilus ampelinus]